MANHFKAILVLIVTLLHAQAYVAAAQPRFLREIGVQSGFGYGIDLLNLPEGNYAPVYYMGYVAGDVFYKRSNGRKEQIYLYAEPQYNRVYQKGIDTKQEYELGINIGFKMSYSLTKKLLVYAQIGAGPHYYSATTARQAPGFLFSDNMGAGLQWFVTQSIFMNTSFRIRHLSNGDTRQPNHGINTNNYMFGIGWKL